MVDIDLEADLNMEDDQGSTGRSCDMPQIPTRFAPVRFCAQGGCARGPGSGSSLSTMTGRSTSARSAVRMREGSSPCRRLAETSCGDDSTTRSPGTCRERFMASRVGVVDTVDDMS